MAITLHSLRSFRSLRFRYLRYLQLHFPTLHFSSLRELVNARPPDGGPLRNIPKRTEVNQRAVRASPHGQNLSFCRPNRRFLVDFDCLIEFSSLVELMRNSFRLWIVANPFLDTSHTCAFLENRDVGWLAFFTGLNFP